MKIDFKKDLKKDLFLVVLILAAALLLFVVNSLLPKHTTDGKVAEITMAPDAVEYVEASPEPTEEPAETAAPEPTEVPADTAAPEETKAPRTAGPAMIGPAGPMPAADSAVTVRGHVVITLNGRQYGDPIPMDREKIITIRQDDGKINKVHITPDSVYMESSTCENQDCIGEGVITLENYTERILGTYIICMPNGVQIEMIPEEQK